MHACLALGRQQQQQEDSMSEVNLGYIERMRPVSAREQDSVNKAKQIINMCTNKTKPTTKNTPPPPECHDPVSQRSF